MRLRGRLIGQPIQALAKQLVVRPTGVDLLLSAVREPGELARKVGLERLPRSLGDLVEILEAAAEVGHCVVLLSAPEGGSGRRGDAGVRRPWQRSAPAREQGSHRCQVAGSVHKGYTRTEGVRMGVHGLSLLGGRESVAALDQSPATPTAL